MPTRRTVLVAGTAALGVAAVGGVSVALRRPTLPLTAEALRPLVGSRFDVEGRTVTLAGVGPAAGAAREADGFRLTFTAAGPLDLPGGTRTFVHDTGDLLLHTEPVGAAGTTVEAVVLRSA
ncbi:DUF6916 family protein [Cellulomonas sp. Marseille-Q8402]